MLYSVKNDRVSFTADTFGAELHSLTLDGKEYLWQCGDAWKRYAPVLFPFVCSPEGRAYRAGGKDYKMAANHGFARDSEFRLESQSGSGVGFVLTENETTLAQYPYRFEFTVSYSALDNGVAVLNEVRNTDDKPIYFYVGGHPAFNCPLEPGETFEDYYIEYERDEHIADSTGAVLAESGRVLDVTRGLFDNDAIIIGDPASKAVSLKSRKGSSSVTVRWERCKELVDAQGVSRFPEGDCIAVWSPTGGDRAAFVCLEPWTSVPVYADDEFPDIERKPHAVKLEPGELFLFRYTIELT